MHWQALMLQAVGPEPVSTKRSKKEAVVHTKFIIAIA